jgi:ribose/xylose/arabinose/galactoside ABC-type transport system permease subunit
MAESPVMLATSGLDVSTTKVLVFCASAFFAAIGGGLLVTQYGSIAGLAFSPLQSLLLVAVLGICGTALVRSSVLAAVLIAVLPGYVHALDTNTQQFVFGLAAVVAGLALANRPALAAWFARSAAETEDRVERGPISERVRATRRGDGDGRGRRRPVFAGRGAR